MTKSQSDISLIAILEAYSRTDCSTLPRRDKGTIITLSSNQGDMPSIMVLLSHVHRLDTRLD
jgi:hypothetical protein